MIFTPDHSALYVSMPKTGCTTIKTVMAGAAGLLDPAASDFGSGRNQVHGLWLEEGRRWNRLPEQQRQRMLRSGETFRFTSVRDPFERIVSCYLSKVASNTSRNRLRRMMMERNDLTLLGFLKLVQRQPFLERDIHCQRQVDISSWGNIGFDFLIRYENFSADLLKVIGRLNVPNLRIPKRNPNAATHAGDRLEDLLGADEIALVREIYEADFEAFGYPIAAPLRDIAEKEREDAVLRIGVYEFRPARKTLVDQKGETLRLTDKEASILKYLHRAGSKSVSREELLVELWGHDAGVTAHRLESHIHRLRQKIEPEPDHSRLLITEVGGYRLSR